METKQEALRASIVCEAKKWIGTSFHHQGRIRQSNIIKGGCDCLGLIIGIAKSLSFKSKFDGKVLTEHDKKHYSKYPQKNKLAEKLEKHLTVVNKAYIQKGDIGLFAISSIPQHIGVFDVDGSICLIHAYQDVGYVCKHNYDEYWKSRLIKIFNFNELC